MLIAGSQIPCYARLIGLTDTGFIEESCQRYRYAPVVFLAPPWEEIYAMDCERRQDFVEAERTFEVMVEVYLEYGYKTTLLSKVTPTARAQFIVDALDL
ncbi:MAG TPA: AAA family ATPase [Bryobacteraceae bacterium]|nr:AAA family ATPase [Bryobacteraceae bacterium]